jgi:HK97 family phage major capsid protein
MTARSSRTTVRQMETSNGALKFPSLQNDPASLLGRPWNEASFMDNTVAAGKHPLVYGDFSNFVVTQRVGATVELIPHLFGSNQRPTGQRGLLHVGAVRRGLDQRFRVYCPRMFNHPCHQCLGDPAHNCWDR